MRVQAVTCSGLYIPVQPGVMRPSRLTSVISATTRAAPPTAREPRFTRCQSLGVPSSAEYWHMGDTTIRFESSMSRRDRKSTRLNSSHTVISYAVFCLKKKKMSKVKPAVPNYMSELKDTTVIHVQEMNYRM